MNNSSIVISTLTGAVIGFVIGYQIYGKQMPDEYGSTYKSADYTSIWYTTGFGVLTGFLLSVDYE